MSNRIELEHLLEQWLYFDEEISKHYNIDVYYESHLPDWKYESRLFGDVSEYIEKETTSEIYKYTDEVNDLVLEKEGILLELNNLYIRREEILLSILDDEYKDEKLTKDKDEIINDMLELNTSTYSERNNLIHHIQEYYVEEETYEELYSIVEKFIIEIKEELDDEYIIEDYGDLDYQVVTSLELFDIEDYETISKSIIKDYIINNHAKPKEEED
ncbi:hypothetical protein [Arcobacter sp. YIC-310]|uniref:hypothetical protein n=1 Tax=Arcobacter sp. YIC-310 TaxID=3376632 RepID=UPI003C23A00C